MCIDVCVDICADICAGICIEMGIDTCIVSWAVLYLAACRRFVAVSGSELWVYIVMALYSYGDK